MGLTMRHVHADFSGQKRNGGKPKVLLARSVEAADWKSAWTNSSEIIAD